MAFGDSRESLYEFLLDARWEIDEVLLYDRSPLESEKFMTSTCRPVYSNVIVDSAFLVLAGVQSTDLSRVLVIRKTPN